MQHLRIVGVNDEENVPQLILSDESGQEFALPVDEALRHAAARPAVRPSQSVPVQNPLTPREIQARLRGGATVDQVVAASGLSTAHVQRYAGPVHAERSYMAQRARSTQVAPASAAEAHRMAFGDGPASLEAMVKVRLRAMDVDLSTLSWDSWRREDGLWQITCVFDVDSSATHGAGIGLKPPAEWIFQAETRHLRAANRWAEALSVLGPSAQTASSSQPPAAGGARRLSAVDSVFDVEESAESRVLGTPTGADPRQDAGRLGTRGAARTGEQAPRGEGREHEDLLDVLRARRGQRLGADAEADDRLALMLNRQDPHQAGHPADAPADEDDEEHSTLPIPRLRPVKDQPSSEDADESETTSPRHRRRGKGFGGPAPAAPDSEHAQGDSTEPLPLEVPRVGSQASSQARSQGQDQGQDQAQDEGHGGGPGDGQASAEDSEAQQTGPGLSDGRLDAWGFAYEGEPEERGDADPDPVSGDDPGGPPQDAAAEQPSAAEKPRKRSGARRPNMPKWDDILFGSKND